MASLSPPFLVVPPHPTHFPPIPPIPCALSASGAAAGVLRHVHDSVADAVEDGVGVLPVGEVAGHPFLLAPPVGGVQLRRVLEPGALLDVAQFHQHV